MSQKTKNECCNGCKNGKPGQNPSCQAKLMIDAIHKARAEKNLELKTEGYEN